MAAERWQQWMPFHIDRFRGSPSVQAMHPAARVGYLYLLASAWQTEDCTISDDAFDLAEASGLGDELWVVYGPRILRMFSPCGEGRLSNAVLKAEWDEAFAIYERRQQQKELVAVARSEAGKKGNAKRWQKGNRASQTHRNCDADPSQNDGFATSEDRNAIANDRLTGTGTGTGTIKQKQVPESLDAPPAVIGFPLVSGEMHLVSRPHYELLCDTFPAVNVMQQLREMHAWLIANPKRQKTAAGVHKFIHSWLASEQKQAQERAAAGKGSSAMVGMNRAPVEPPANEQDLRETQKEFWRLQRGSPAYQAQAPAWVKRELDAEALCFEGAGLGMQLQ